MNNFEFSKEYILSIPKTIDENGCWIPDKQPESHGYVYIKSNYVVYLLHRVSMCVFHGVDYTDSKIDTRHSEVCPRSCFNPDHLKPGSQRDNILDTIKHGRHNNASKTCCPRCGGGYKQYRIKSGPRRGDTLRECPVCRRARRKAKRNR